jgi:dTDP-glucose pyrophosphorylase
VREAEDLTVRPDTSVREAMDVLDRGAAEIVFATTHGGRLVGTVTDGDIRRAILRGVSLTSPVEDLMAREFTSVGRDVPRQALLDLFQSRDIKHIPVIGVDGQLLGVHRIKDFLGRQERANWSIIMAGGQGRRLRPLTDTTPKPMLEVGGQPLLERIVAQLAAAGLKRIFLSVGYLGHQIEEHFGDGGRFGCQLEYLREDEPLGTGGALSLLPDAPKDPLVVLNGDLVTEVRFGALLDYHVRHGFSVTACVKDLAVTIPHGVCRIDGRSVVEFVEKPTHRFLINAGIYVLEPSVLSMIPAGQLYDLPDIINELGSRGEEVGAYAIRESWMDIGNVEDYQRIVKESDSDCPPETSI